jgi:hypothetical protein
MVAKARRKFPQLEQSSDDGAIRTFCTTARDTPDVMLLPAPLAGADGEARQKYCDTLDPLLVLPVGRQVFVLYGASGLAFPGLTREMLFRAMARELPRRDADGSATSRFERNPNQRWSDIAPGLPDEPIRLLLPPRRSVVWLALEDLVMRPGCAAVPAISALARVDQQAASQRCLARRTDAVLVYADQAQYDTAPRSPSGTELGLNELRFVPANVDILPVEGALPDRAGLATGRYRLARQVVAVAKRNRLDGVPNLRDFLLELTSTAAAGPGGYLQRRGLDPLPDSLLSQSANLARYATPEAVRRLQGRVDPTTPREIAAAQ